MNKEKAEIETWVATETGDFDDLMESFESRDEAVSAGVAAFDGTFFVARMAIFDMEVIDR